ncbi:hypothetical protein, partial [Nocardia sp. NPDC003345]
ERLALRADLSGVPDERAVLAGRILGDQAPDTNALERLVARTTGGPEPAALRALLALELPPSQRVTILADRIDAARAAVRAASTPAAAADLRILELLRAARAHATRSESEEHPGTLGAGPVDGCPCPVCGRGELDERWLRETTLVISELSCRTAGLASARCELAAGLAELRVLAEAVPAELVAAEKLAYLDTSALRAAWEQWAALPGSADDRPGRLAAVYERVAVELGYLRGRAGKELDRLDEVWAPFAPRLREWLELNRSVAAGSSELQTVRAAEEWLKSATAQARDERMAPLAGTARWVWQSLRQQSSIELGGIRLQGNANTARRVQLEVTVDEVDGAALGVMSQGELHALGLALFLPRATVAASPFRFVVIDDPVQAMDPAKVDGLARVLATVAWDRQVVVFTHDDRLAEAVRRMQIDARILEVQRRERSVVEVRLSSDPVRRYLDDARALLRTPQLPRSIADELVATCCRSALEAASLARAKRVLLAGGMDHREVQRRIDTAQSTRAMVTLAVLGPGRRIDDLNKELAKEGRWAVEVVRDATAGAHIPIARDLGELIADTGRFVDWLAR